MKRHTKYPLSDAHSLVRNNIQELEERAFRCDSERVNERAREIVTLCKLALEKRHRPME